VADAGGRLLRLNAAGRGLLGVADAPVGGPVTELLPQPELAALVDPSLEGSAS
jgi:hypothetical protein